MLKLFAVKPLLVIYMMSWAVTSSVTTQLWLFKTCRNYYNQTGKWDIWDRVWDVNNNIFSILDNVCKNLTAPEHSDLNNQVQAKVNDWQLYMRYMEVIPSLISLYLGPISGNWFIVLL